MYRAALTLELRNITREGKPEQQQINQEKDALSQKLEMQNSRSMWHAGWLCRCCSTRNYKLVCPRGVAATGDHTAAAGAARRAGAGEDVAHAAPGHGFVEDDAAPPVVAHAAPGHGTSSSCATFVDSLDEEGGEEEQNPRRWLVRYRRRGSSAWGRGGWVGNGKGWSGGVWNPWSPPAEPNNGGSRAVPTMTCYGLGWGALHGAEGQARQSLYRTIKTVEKPVESQRREKMVTASGIDERWKS
ncbi:hypothetical protein BRADI_1g41196v3 [Brachypodium distachyon]|uniref:Uncharacterized protein n=1 Tax=Brachypodium distachyon TaxID=15368 RepID=A0A0Q3H6V7_BRADI|nr:hypothetical protein BRADI_1g41196v3 [Brachypodium distachyon]